MKAQMSNLIKIRLVGAEFFHADGEKNIRQSNGYDVS